MKKIITPFILLIGFTLITCKKENKKLYYENTINEITNLKQLKRSAQVFEINDTLVINLTDTSSYISPYYDQLLSQYIFISLDSLLGKFKAIQFNNFGKENQPGFKIAYNQEAQKLMRLNLSNPESFKYLIFLNNLFTNCSPENYDKFMQIHYINNKRLTGYTNNDPLDVLIPTFIFDKNTNGDTSNIVYKELYAIAIVANRYPNREVASLINTIFNLKELPILDARADAQELPFELKPQ